jgi:hypothetical protein
MLVAGPRSGTLVANLLAPITASYLIAAHPGELTVGGHQLDRGIQMPTSSHHQHCSQSASNNTVVAGAATRPGSTQGVEAPVPYITLVSLPKNRQMSYI